MSETVRHSPEAGLDVVPGEAPAAESQTAEPQAVEATSRPGRAPPGGLGSCGCRGGPGRRCGGGVAGGENSPAAVSGGQPGGPGAATAAVVRGDLVGVDAGGGDAGVCGLLHGDRVGAGTLTWLPALGQVISQGQPVYQTGNGSPVVLLYGTVPEWRVMSEGTTGADVAQLNHDLVALGDASSGNVAGPGWDYFSAATGSGVQLLEEHLGVTSPAASLSPGRWCSSPGRSGLRR